MKSQKFILHSKTIWGATTTFLLAVLPLVNRGIENGFTQSLWWQIVSIGLTTAGTLISRYVAKGEIYTPHGIPGRNYKRFTEQVREASDNYFDP